MNLSFKIFTKLMVAVLLIFTFFTLFFLQKNHILNIWQMIISLVSLVLLFGCFLIPILRSLKHNTLEDMRREDELLSSVVGVNKTKYNHYPFITKCFFGAILFAFSLPLLIKSPFIQRIPYENLEVIISTFGLIAVLSFVILMFFYNKKLK